MKDTLQGLLLNYIRENNPDLLQQLEEDDALHAWVLEKLKEVELVLAQSKPSAALEAQCMDIMTADLRPSRMRYIRDLFEERFPEDHDRMLEAGTLAYELLGMTRLCHELFGDIPVIEEVVNPQLDRLVVMKINDYLYQQISIV